VAQLKQLKLTAIKRGIIIRNVTESEPSELPATGNALHGNAVWDADVEWYGDGNAYAESVSHGTYGYGYARYAFGLEFRKFSPDLELKLELELTLKPEEFLQQN